MTRSRSSRRTIVATSVVAAATTWVALLTWRGFTEDSTTFLRPLLLIGVAVALVGGVGRWYRVPGLAVLAVQLLVAGAATSWALTGSPLPLGASAQELVRDFTTAVQSANRYAPPVPDHVPGVHPLLIAGGAACFVLVDLLACAVRRVPLAGLPLLTIYSVPLSILDGGPSWWVFAVTAAGFLTLLFLQESEQVVRWGRPLGADPLLADDSGFSVRAGASRATAGAVGGVATALAIVVPLAVPTFDVQLFDFGPGDGDGDIKLDNPMVDLRRDLKRDEDVPLVRVTTSDPDPGYLRISVLNRFAENEWSSGDRQIPTDQLADGRMPALEGVSPAVERTEHRYTVTVDDSFDSSWLPTQAPISSVTAQGDWRYDEATMDFIAGDDDLSAAGLSYRMTSVELARRAEDMVSAPPAAAVVDSDFLEVPDGLPPVVRQLAAGVTFEARSPFEKAVALQNWFREEGGFRYSLEVDLGNGSDDLARFLTKGPGGRVGYCEQFAAAMAVMARSLGIPARVAVGFLTPAQVGPRTYEYSSFDLHAWPEIFISGAGWVRFEPTPPSRASGVPSYTEIEVGAVEPPSLPTENPSAENPLDNPRGPDAVPSEAPAEDKDRAGRGTGAGSIPWGPVLGGFAGLLVLAGAAATPRAVRRSRRAARLQGDAEDVWAEVRDTAVDLGVPWPDHRSPRETRGQLVEHLGAPLSDDTPERPSHGAEVAPDAVAALDRLVGALERERYARGAGTTSVGDEGRTVVASLEGGATPRARRRAEWWPRSVLTRRPRPVTNGGASSNRTEVVDHVG